MKTKKLGWGLIAMTMALVISMLVACGPTPTPQVVKETVVVEKEVEKKVEVEVTKVVEVEKEVEVVVTPTPAELPEEGVKVIPFMTTESDPESVAVFQEIIAEYEADHPGVIIDIVLTPHGADYQRLVAAHTVGGDLGVITVHQEHLSDYVEAGWMLPIDDFIDAVGRDKFKPNSVLSLGGHDYAVGYAAAKIDGANAWQLFWYITLPWLKPIILVALMLRTIWLFKHFDLVYLMAFGGPMNATTTVPVLIYQTAFDELRMGRAATISMYLVLILFIAAILYTWAYARAEEQLTY